MWGEKGAVLTVVNTDELVACPRCRQEWLREVTLTALDTHAYLCVECDALYLTDTDVAGASFVDYGTFMESRGRSAPEDPKEIRLGPKLRRRPPQ
jgi:DNA-directed RNA polymerase subunit RPC12/RpoP